MEKIAKIWGLGVVCLMLSLGARAQLKINEVYYNTEGPQEANQFIELYNVGPTNVYLDGLVLSDEAGSGIEGIYRFPGSGTDYPVAPGDYVVIVPDAVTDSYLAAVADWECVADEYDYDNPGVPNLTRVGGVHDLNLFAPGDNVILANGMDTSAPIAVSTIIDGMNFAGGGGELAYLSSQSPDSDPLAYAAFTNSLNRVEEGWDSDYSSAADFVSGMPTPGAANSFGSPLPMIYIRDSSVPEGNSDTTSMVFEVVLSRAPTQTVVITYSTANGTANYSNDYTAVTSNTLVFGLGIRTQTLTVTVSGDLNVELDETFYVNLKNPVNTTLGKAQGVGTILNDETVFMGIGDASGYEGNTGTTNFTFEVTLSEAAAAPVSVTYFTSNGTAMAGSDFLGVTSNTLLFAVGIQTQWITISVYGDVEVEPNETFSVMLANAVGIAIIDGEGVGTILDEDVPAISIADTSVVEGNSGTTNARFKVVLSQAPVQSVQVNYSTADGTALAGSDYTGITDALLTFNPGVRTQWIEVAVQGDPDIEYDENFFVKLTNLVNATYDSSAGLCTIYNDDIPQLTVEEASVVEGQSGTTNMRFAVTLTEGALDTVTVTFYTADNTAVEPDDYVGIVSNQLVFVPGVRTQWVDVVVNGDGELENDETFFGRLKNVVNGGIADAEGVGTIINDDYPSFSISDALVVEGDSGTTTAAFEVTLSAEGVLAATVTVTTADGTAVAPGDYTALAGTVLSFEPGIRTQYVEVVVNGDTDAEEDENFYVQLTNAANATYADAVGVGTIQNDDMPAMSIGDVAVVEGEGGTTNALFEVTLSASYAQTVTVVYSTADGTAVEPSDYTAIVSNTLSFDPGIRTQWVEVVVNGDTDLEPNEQFTVSLTDVVNAVLVDAEGVGTILSDELPSLSIGDVAVMEGNSGITTARFEVTLSAESVLATTVTVMTADGTAVAPGDYTALAGTVLSFDPGIRTQYVDVVVQGDTDLEPDETFYVKLTNAVNATYADATGVGTILNDDLPTLSIGDVAVVEGDSGTTNAEFTILLSAESVQTVGVVFATADGTAVAPADYTANPSNEVIFLPGIRTQIVSVAVNGDTDIELDEAFYGRLTSAANATIFDDEGTATILNDDYPAVSIGDVAVVEGDSGTTNAQFEVTLSAEGLETLTVTYMTADGTAVAPGDYTGITSNELVFAAGVRTQLVTVTVQGDTDIEPDETFDVQLANVVHGTLSDAEGVGTILNDDLPALSIGDVAIMEGNSGITTAAFEVTMSAAYAETVTVVYSTSDGTAVAPSDYTAIVSNTLSFDPGIRTQWVEVVVNGDTDVEPDELFTVSLTNAVNATYADATGVGTILNDDLPNLSIGDATLAEGQSGTTNAQFEVTLSESFAQTVTVMYSTADGTAVAPSDYTAIVSNTLSFDPGIRTQWIEVAVNGDTSIETDEVFYVILSNPTNATILDAQDTGTILDDDYIRLEIYYYENGDVTNRWNSISGVTYRLLYSDDLVNPAWTNVGDDVTAVGTTAEQGDLGASLTVTQRFYRVLRPN